MVGNSEAIDGAIKALWKHGLVLKAMECLQDYFSSKVKLSMDK